ncbi:MAG: AraC family transcriptional regulator [Gemmatimonas sp.]
MHITTIAHHSALGSWTHCECVPGVLGGAVEKLWHFEGRMSLLRERSFPRVYSEIILQLGPRFRDVSAAGISGDYFPQACFAGATTAPSVIEAPDAVCCVIGIQLHASAAFRLLGFSPRLTHNTTISLDDALGPGSCDLAERCYEASTVNARFEIIVRFLRDRLAQTDVAHRAIEWAACQLRQTSGQTKIATLQENSELSKSRFVALFRDQTGFAPKQYARILRFRNSLQLLQLGHKLSDAALSAGYYDQAHFHNEFSEFAKITPASFVSALRFPNSMSLPENS